MIYGYFTNANQTMPEYDPGLDVDCPICNHPLRGHQLMTISVMGMESKRSWFYRVHRDCYKFLSEVERVALDSAIIDADAMTRNAN